VTGRPKGSDGIARSARATRWVAAVVVAVAVLAGCVGGHSSPAPSSSALSDPLPVTATSPPTPSGRSSSVAPLPAPVARPMRVGAAWPIGARTLWEWTAANRGHAERVELTTDAGRAWSDVTPAGLASWTKATQINGLFALDRTDAWVTYGPIASYSQQLLKATTDGGRTWRALGRVPDRQGCDVQFVSPKDGTCTFVGAAAASSRVTIYRTTTGGATWRLMSRTRIYQNKPHELPYACDKNINFTSAATGWAIFACAGGVGVPLYRTSDGGATWSAVTVHGPNGRLDDGYTFTDNPVLTGADGAVAMTRGYPARVTVYTSGDGGASWSPMTLAGPAAGWFLDAVTARHWVLVAGDRLLITHHAGRSWQHRTMSHRFAQLSADYNSPLDPVVDFVSDRVGWIRPTFGDEWRTSDGGRHWQRLVAPPS
jgi:photosystem II stability/assembly factor-like uncharacterized protein